jgi:hypothetical protein
MRAHEAPPVETPGVPGPHGPASLVLQEAVIAVHRPQQVKFSELYMDMFRMLQGGRCYRVVSSLVSVHVNQKTETF